MSAAQPLSKQDREAILYNARNPIPPIDIILPHTVERYEATVERLESVVARWSDALDVALREPCAPEDRMRARSMVSRLRDEVAGPSIDGRRPPE